jgi:hypothetical protein
MTAWLFKLVTSSGVKGVNYSPDSFGKGCSGFPPTMQHCIEALPSAAVESDCNPREGQRRFPAQPRDDGQLGGVALWPSKGPGLGLVGLLLYECIEMATL